LNLLAIDCACSFLSVAASRGDEIFITAAEGAMKQSEIIMDCIDSVMRKASLQPKDLNGVLCMGGPGSFTGLRIGYSIAKGLALSLAIPFAAVPTLDCIALAAHGNERENDALILSIINANKHAFYYAFYRSEMRLAPDSDGDCGQIINEIKSLVKPKEKIIIAGPGSALFYRSLPQDLAGDISIVCSEASRAKEENAGYSEEIIAIVKKLNILDNDSSAFLYSGPEYKRPPV